MEIKLAEEMGFCFGVRRAIELVQKEAQENPGKHYTTFGQLVHNPVVVNRMEKLGVDNTRDMTRINDGVVAFTAHGTPPETFEEAQEKGLEMLDATCPLVKIIQDSARSMVEQGFKVIVYGDRNHPEVKSIVGWAGKDTIATMDFNDIKDMRPPKRIGIVSQSTQILEHFRQFVTDVNNHFLGKTKEIKVHNTICAPTTRLQSSAEELAQECQVMVVIGGKSSANTAHLADICRAQGATTYKIEGSHELDPAWFEGVETVGVTAGASTPDESIEEVVAWLKALDMKREAAQLV
ncbi:MAG TPA: 4-hydroxy-3-methylbut-2-enyl diphosphate reductase [Chloroflexia bacterium]|nr:4-hydroxy-3-methylbut-2-enyl diphosphate reductase [Chloroflexia bacterium]